MCDRFTLNFFYWIVNRIKRGCWSKKKKKTGQLFDLNIN